MSGEQVMSGPRAHTAPRFMRMRTPIGVDVRKQSTPPIGPATTMEASTFDATTALASSPVRPVFTPLAGRVLAVDALALIVAVALVSATMEGLSLVGLVVVLPLWVLGLHRLGGYSESALEEGPLRSWDLYSVAGRAALVLAVVPILYPAFQARTYVTLLISLLLATVTGRHVFTRWLRVQQARGRYVVPVVLRGPAEDIEALQTVLARDCRQPFSVVAVQATSGRLTSDLAVPAHQNPVDIAGRMGAAAVMFVGPQSDPPEVLRRRVWTLESAGIRVAWVPIASPVSVPKAFELGRTGVPVLTFEDRDVAPEKSVGKMVADWSLALLACVLFLPLILLAAVAISLDSPGPVLFRQTRVGRGGSPFTMFKLRTMSVDAEDQLQTLTHLNVHEGGTLFKIPDDPRVTRVGKWLRKYSLDELPQLLNVLRGDMSLVGPRPPLPDEVRNYPNDLHRRFLVRPGLTGLWQVSGRSDLNPTESARLDTHYVEHWTPWMDARILFKTVNVVLGSDGVY